MLIALIVLGVICLAQTGALIYFIRIVAACKVSQNGYEFHAAITPGKKDAEPKRKRGMF